MVANPQPTYASFLGVAKEVTVGTAVPPTMFIPITTMTLTDKLTLLPDQGWRAAPVKTYSNVPGPLYAEYEFGGDVYADCIGWPVAGILGDVTVSGVAAPYTTTCSTLCSGNFQPPSYTLTDWNSQITGYQLAGCRFSELALKFSGAGKLEYTAKASALTNATTTKPTFANPPTSIYAGWTGTVKIGGTTVGYTVDGEITLKRAIEVIDTADGTQSPYALFAGEVEADGKLTIVMEDDTKRAAYVAGTSTSIEVNYTQSTGATTQQLLVHASNVYLTDAKVSRGKAYVELEVPFECDANTTDVGGSGGFSPVKVTIQNQMPTGTYK